MVSKRWQRKQSFIQHAALFLFWGGILFWPQVGLPWLQKLLLILLTCTLSVVGGYLLNRRFAASLVRVFKFNDEVAIDIVQRALNANYIRFSRLSVSEEVHFIIRGEGLKLVIEDFPLNLPIDDHISTIPAAKIEIQGLNRQNNQMAEKLTEIIDDVVAVQMPMLGQLK